MPVMRTVGNSSMELEIMLKGNGKSKVYSTRVEASGEEIVVPVSKLGITADKMIYFNAIATENGKSVSFSNADETRPQTWQHIRL